jgi:hypothetical protein
LGIWTFLVWRIIVGAEVSLCLLKYRWFMRRDFPLA